MSDDNPYSAPASRLDALSAEQADGDVSGIMGPLARRAGWMKFVAIMTIIASALGAIGTLGIGLVVLWLPIWGSVVLLQAAGASQRAVAEGSVGHAREANDKLGLCFVLMGVVFIIYIAFFCVGFLLGIGGVIMAVGDMQRMQGQ